MLSDFFGPDALHRIRMQDPIEIDQQDGTSVLGVL
jgi:hypothetical protein